MRLLAATGDAVARLDGDGDGFRVSTSLEGSGAQCLAAGEGAVYVGCRGSGVWRSDDDGAGWRNLHLPEQDVFSFNRSLVRINIKPNNWKAMAA